MEASLRPLLVRPALRAGVFGLDLGSGAFFDLAGDQAFSAASLIKIPVAAALLAAVDTGAVSLDEMIVMGADDIGGGSGSLQYLPVGSRFTVRRLAELMIRRSDNTATNMLIGRLGGIDACNASFAAWGLGRTRLRTPLPDMNGTNTTSPRDLVTVLEKTLRGTSLRPASRELLLSWMRRSHVRSLLPAGVGRGSRVANKTGDIPGALGDAGFVEAPGGKRYLLAVQVERPHNSHRANELIRDVSRSVYQSLTGLRAPAPPATVRRPTRARASARRAQAPARDAARGPRLLKDLAMLRAVASGLTDIGMLREENQDHLGDFEPENAARALGRLLIVADGVGGHRGGRVASGMAVAALADAYYRIENDETLPSGSSPCDRAAARALVPHGQRHDLHESAAGSGRSRHGLDLHRSRALCGERRSSATSATAAPTSCATGRSASSRPITPWCRSASTPGSSRRKRRARTRTGTSSPAASGFEPEIEPEIVSPPIVLQKGDRFILSTDGLHGVISDEEIRGDGPALRSRRGLPPPRRGGQRLGRPGQHHRPGRAHRRILELPLLAFRRVAAGARAALLAGAQAPQDRVRVDPGRVPVRPDELHAVVADTVPEPRHHVLGTLAGSRIRRPVTSSTHAAHGQRPRSSRAAVERFVAVLPDDADLSAGEDVHPPGRRGSRAFRHELLPAGEGEVEGSLAGRRRF
jgi:beta-lactamase class A